MGRRRYLSVIAFAAAMLAAGSLLARDWKPLASDGEHDPAGPGITELQQPGQALTLLPPDPNGAEGNQVNWAQALDEGDVNPRSKVLPDTSVNVLDLDVILKNTSMMYYVRFPHKPHTEWLDCSQCHEKLFRSKAGATKINMFMILMGQKCGLCHGAVAFPLTECGRCHSVPWDDMPAAKK